MHKLKYSMRNLSQCHFSCHKHTLTSLGLNQDCKADEQLPEPWHSHIKQEECTNNIRTLSSNCTDNTPRPCNTTASHFLLCITTNHFLLFREIISLLWQSYEMYKCVVWAKCGVYVCLKPAVQIDTTAPWYTCFIAHVTFWAVDDLFIKLNPVHITHTFLPPNVLFPFISI